MNALYLDTSVLVSLHTAEAESDAVSDWLERRPERAAISDWTTVEFASALSMKVRIGQLRLSDREHVMQTFATFARGIIILPVTADHFDAAVTLLARPQLALRGPDALHLAICADHGDHLVTRDRKLARAALAFDVKVVVPD